MLIQSIASIVISSFLQLKDGFQDQFKKSFEPIVLEGELKEEEYDTENVTVQIVELSTDQIAESNNWIGRNKPVYECDKTQSSEEEHDSEEEEVVPGFEVSSKKPKKKQKVQKDDEDGDDDGDEAADGTDEPKRKKRIKKLPEDIKSKRAVGQFFAKQAHNTLKHSKAFRMKNRLEQNRSKKKARIEKEKKTKLQNKREKHKKNSAKGKPKKEPKFNDKKKKHK